MASTIPRIKGGRFLSRINQLIAVALLVMILIFAVAMYLNAQNTVLNTTNEANKQVLYQIDYNVSLMSEMVKNIALSVFFSPDAISLMRESFHDDNLYQAIKHMENIRNSLLNINPYIHSIFIYNNIDDMYYSSYRSIVYQDPQMQDIIAGGEKIPALMPIVRTIEGNQGAVVPVQETVITYCLYQGDFRSGAVVLNVKSQWFLDNIKSLNRATEDEGELIYLIDSNHNLIHGAETKGTGLEESIKGAMLEDIRASIRQGDHIGFRTVDIDGTRYYLTYLYIKDADWIVIKLQDYNKVFKYINDLKLSIVLITVLFLVLAVLFSRTISSRIYKPIAGLVKQVLSNADPIQPVGAETDEIAFLQDYYRASGERLMKAAQERDANLETLKSYYLGNLILDSYHYSEAELARLQSEGLLSVDVGGPLTVCLFSVDPDRKQQRHEYEIDRIKSLIEKETSELIGRHARHQMIQMKNDLIACLVEGGDINGHVAGTLISDLREAQRIVLEKYGISFSCSVGKPIVGYKNISQEYGNALANLAYRFVMGFTAVITPDNISRNVNNNQVNFYAPLEKKLIEDLKSCNIEQIEDDLHQMMVLIAPLSYSCIGLTVFRLLNAVKDTLMEINQLRLEPAVIDFASMQARAMDSPTIDGLYYELMNMIRTVLGTKGSDNIEKWALLVKTVQHIIITNYSNPSLCLQQIASSLKMSSNYVGRLYREMTGISIADSINNVRIEKAAHLLETTRISVTDVMQRVGIVSESHFYKHFKKRYGVTPREYILRKAVDRL